MPWTVIQTKSCPPSKPWGVVKSDTRALVACHETEQKANQHKEALYANAGSEAKK